MGTALHGQEVQTLKGANLDPDCVQTDEPQPPPTSATPSKSGPAHPEPAKAEPAGKGFFERLGDAYKEAVLELNASDERGSSFLELALLKLKIGAKYLFLQVLM